MEMESKNFASKGVGGTALGLAIGALGIEAVRGGIGGLFGGGNCNGYNNVIAEKDAKIAELSSDLKLREAVIMMREESNALRNYVDTKDSATNAKIDALNAQLCTQAVFNASTTATINCINGQIAQLLGLTKTVIPFTSICPEPMPATNTWVAPTTTTTTG